MLFAYLSCLLDVLFFYFLYWRSFTFIFSDIDINLTVFKAPLKHNNISCHYYSIIVRSKNTFHIIFTSNKNVLTCPLVTFQYFFFWDMRYDASKYTLVADIWLISSPNFIRCSVLQPWWNSYFTNLPLRLLHQPKNVFENLHYITYIPLFQKTVPLSSSQQPFSSGMCGHVLWWIIPASSSFRIHRPSCSLVLFEFSAAEL